MSGLVYDRFGDFEGFLLMAEDGRERYFESAEPRIEALADRAWADRILISVFTRPGDPRLPASIVLRNW